jgi:hypothetical protein
MRQTFLLIVLASLLILNSCGSTETATKGAGCKSTSTGKKCMLIVKNKDQFQLSCLNNGFLSTQPLRSNTWGPSMAEKPVLPGRVIAFRETSTISYQTMNREEFPANTPPDWRFVTFELSGDSGKVYKLDQNFRPQPFADFDANVTDNDLVQKCGE